MGSGIVDVVDHKTLFLHRIPLLGRLVRPRLNGEYVRDEAYQGRELAETLGILDTAGVDGAFVFTFVFPFTHIMRILDMTSTWPVPAWSKAMPAASRGVPIQIRRGNQSSRLERWPSTTPLTKLGSVHP